MIGRLIRQLKGRGKREAMADEILRLHDRKTAPAKREIKARSLALERLVAQLQKDTATWH